MPPCQENSRSFFEKLQNADGLDLRDNRGKRHELAIVLVGVTIAILSNRDGSLSSIERHLKNHYEKLELAQAIRGHWQVETNNHIRDLSLREDEMRSKKEFTKNNGRNQIFGNNNFGENKVSKQKSPIREFCR